MRACVSVERSTHLDPREPLRYAGVICVSKKIKKNGSFFQPRTRKAGNAFWGSKMPFAQKGVVLSNFIYLGVKFEAKSHKILKW